MGLPIFELSKCHVFALIREHGPVLRDLFAHDDETSVWFKDPVLVKRHAAERYQTASNDVATQWKLGIAGLLAVVGRLTGP